MKRSHHIGLERRDGFDVGRDPLSMSAAELEYLGHGRVSPLRALRLKCLDCCNGSAQQVRLCNAVDCPSWPFRMGKNPWGSPLSAEVKTQRAASMTRNRASALSNPDKTQAQIDTSDFHGGRMPEEAPADFSPTGNSDDAGGVS